MDFSLRESYMSDLMTRIKTLMNRYDQLQRSNNEAAALRKQLVQLLKQAELTKTKFNFGDRTISYHYYNNYENITQQLIRSVIKDKYPQINADRFLADVCAARKSKPAETLRVQTKLKDSKIKTF